MLKIKILKTTHKGEDEARKLLPFISDCHVFGPEVGGMTEQQSIENEEQWLRVLNSGISRSQFKRGMKPFPLSDDPDIKAMATQEKISYFLKLTDYLYRAKMPKWHCERLTPDEAEIVFQQRKLSAHLQREQERMLLLGDVDGYLKAASLYLKNIKDSLDFRDKAIARCLETAEAHLRNLVNTFIKTSQKTAVSEHKPLVYAVQIGGSHAPENYVRDNGSLEVQIVDLAKNEGTSEDNIIIGGYLHGKTIEDLRKELLVKGLLYLRKNRVISLSHDAIRQMSQTGLEGCIREFSRSAEVINLAKKIEQYNRSQGFYS
ncbi:hypothetical protein HYU06_03250 [Candidatus Woesearchaeota archaeon]|nr:hypothetical protein [Candidatus Woesearchaeota archaeon]